MKTLYDKIWESHTVTSRTDDSIIFIDRHLLHEVTSPQAFETLKQRRLQVIYPERAIAMTDHNVPTDPLQMEITSIEARAQVEKLQENCQSSGISLYDLEHDYQGIVHVVAPELGYIQPGMTVVCGDSHTSTNGAFGALGFGIGTSEIAKVLATQTIKQTKSKNMLIRINGVLPEDVTAKDVALYLIGMIGTTAGTGFVAEYQGSVVEELSIEGRMTLCNMIIEAGARAGLIAPDEKTIAYLKGLIHSPVGGDWQDAVKYWRTLRSDDDSSFDKVIYVCVDQLQPQVTWGTNPSQVVDINGVVPFEGKKHDQAATDSHQKSLAYMGFSGGERIRSIKVDVVFIGSCTNSRIEDLRSAAEMINGRKCHESVAAYVVPGSKSVARQARAEGLQKIFEEAGFHWRLPGCSMCVGINGDSVAPGLRCASTSNRNFEGRQGAGSRTHLVSPRVAASTAISGYFSDA